MTTPGSRQHFVRDMLTWLNRRFPPGEGRRITANTRLFADGYVNSIRILDIIAWVEEATGRRIPDRAIRMDNFQTVARIAATFREEGERHAVR